MYLPTQWSWALVRSENHSISNNVCAVLLSPLWLKLRSCADVVSPYAAILMASREELETALAGLKKEETAVTSKLKAVKRRAAAVQRHWVLPPNVRRASVAAYIAGGYAVEPAVEYRVAYGRQRQWPARGVGELGEVVHDLVLATRDDDIAELATLQGLPDVGAFAAALSYAREWRAVVYARRLIEQSGIAPSTAQLLTHVEAFGGDLPDAARQRA